ncbi:MAG TPA: transcription termination/antitermination protein NusG [Actinomycetota bacterium]|nr:transcription termination/antitermination protein NusG [Actinomycetota bacterium]
MNDHAPEESEAGAEPEAEAESLEDQVAQAVADAAVQEAIADGAIAQALEETVVEDIEAAASLEQASDAAIQESYEEKVADAVAEGLEGDALADAVAQAAADADVQEAIADGAIAQALEETIVEDVQAAQTVEEVSDEGIAENLEERVTELVEASEPAEPAETVEAEEPAEAAVAPKAEEVEAPKVEAEAEAEVETAVRDPFRGPGDWYVVHTYAGYENKVKTNLESRIHTMQMEDKIFDVHIPMEDVMEIKGGKKQIVQRKVFPGYLLVKMTYDNDSWYVVRNTPGVTGFVAAGTGSKPTPLSRREVEKILAVKKEEVKPTFRLGFEEGDVVRIISGPFADFNGTISEINVDQSKLKVLVNIFDRETPVELGFDQVAKV